MGEQDSPPAPKKMPPEGTRKPVPWPLACAIVGGLIALAFVAYPVRVPAFFAAVCAISVQRLHQRLARAMGQRPRSAGGLLTLGFLVGIVGPVAALVFLLAKEVRSGLAWVADSLGIKLDGSIDLPSSMETGIAKLADTLHLERDDIRGIIERAGQTLEASVPMALTLPLGLFGGLLLLLIGFYFFTVDGHQLSRFVLRAVPLKPEETHEILQEFRNTCSGALLSCASNCVGQGLVLFAGFAVAGVPHPMFFGVMAVFAALIPLVGSFLVWIPAVVVLAVSGKSVAAAALAVWSLVMVALVDNLVKPLMLRGKLDMHGGLLLLGFVGGAAMFGPMGLVGGPLVVAGVVTLLRIYQRDYLKSA